MCPNFWDELVVSVGYPKKNFPTLTLFVMGEIQPYFCYLAIWVSTFQAYYDLDLKSKVVIINGKTLDK